MISIGWNILLFALKFVLILLIYGVLLMVLRAVRREMSMRLESAPKEEAAIVPGRLKITDAGIDSPSRLGEMILLKTETRLGAHSDNDVILKDPYVSGHHARLRWDGIEWWIEDLGSRNGTYVNQVQCLPNAPQPVPNGANIKIGEMRFTLME